MWTRFRECEGKEQNGGNGKVFGSTVDRRTTAEREDHLLRRQQQQARQRNQRSAPGHIGNLKLDLPSPSINERLAYWSSRTNSRLGKIQKSSNPQSKGHSSIDHEK